MAVQQGYGKMAGANSLVFAYDTGDTVNSYKGEPTVNITPIYNLAWSTLSGTRTPNAIEDSDGVLEGMKLTGTENTQVRTEFTAALPSSETQYTFSVEGKKGSTPFIGLLTYLRPYPSPWVVYNVDTGELNGGGTVARGVEPVRNGWYRIWMTVTIRPDQLNNIFKVVQTNSPTNAAAGTTGGFVYYAKAQLEVKNHLTPFTRGTRSATEGLLDLTGNQTIDLSSTSFDANAQPVLDGTEEYKDLGSDQVIKTSGGWTVESVVYYNSVAGGYDNYISPANFTGSDSTSYNSWYWSVLNNKLALWNINPGVWKYGSTTIQANTWYHTVLTCSDDGTSYQMYLNGVAEGGNHTTYSWNPSYSGLKVRYIGAGRPNLRFINGEVPVTKIYDKALTAAEVQANFNNYKTRFNIS